MSQPPQTPPPPPPDSGAGWQAPAGQSWDQPPAAGGQPASSNGFAIAALVCGIIALLLSWIPVINILALVLGIAAVICGVVGMRRAAQPGVGQRGIAVGGLVTGIVAILLSVLIFVGLVAVFSDPEVREPIERIFEGEDPEEVIEELERQMEESRPN